MDQYLVEMSLPEFTEEFVELIPAQRAYVNECMVKGSILSYSLAEDRSKLWVVFAAKSRVEMLKVLHKFPVIRFVKVKTYPLMFHNSMELMLPAISLN
ncbi:MAG: hypothetical protein JSS76_08755 [Bacteroidetes bacterium]|nr:hypothetical protein [Bacteroidota bacterium]MBS1684830.1 hypothetical protein [Bacteroidota bacterium]